MFEEIEDIFLGLDEWAYDIEQEYKTNGFVEPKKKRQYVNICATRDKYYDIYRKRIYGGWVPIPKSCNKRALEWFKPPSKQPHPQI